MGDLKCVYHLMLLFIFPFLWFHYTVCHSPLVHQEKQSGNLQKKVKFAMDRKLAEYTSTRGHSQQHFYQLMLRALIIPSNVKPSRKKHCGTNVTSSVLGRRISVVGHLESALTKAFHVIVKKSVTSYYRHSFFQSHERH